MSNPDVAMLRMRYHAAFGAYRAARTRNAAVAVSGGRPSDEQVDEEARALASLEAARDTMFDELAR